MSITIRAASETHLPILAQMNKYLIEDEGSRNPMSVSELEQRMRGWMHGDWNVDLFLEEETIVGYAVYQFRPEEFFPDKCLVYLRQLYIDRAKRSRGLGRLALQSLVQSRFPKECTVAIDVLAVNPRGAKFWAQVGFQPYWTRMHFKPSE